MVRRKNDGVKMTSQLATKNAHSLGMTADDGTLDRYLETINRGRPSVDKHLAAVEIPRPIVLTENSRYKLKLIRYEKDCYYFIRENLLTRLGQRSITYGSKPRAMQVFEADKIVWFRETYSLRSVSVPC